jgi:hypothetical protein
VLKQINQVSTKLSQLLPDQRSSATAGMDAMYKTISEVLLTIEAKIKGIHMNYSMENSMASYSLVSEQAINNCLNQDLIRRAVEQTQMGIIPQIKVSH